MLDDFTVFAFGLVGAIGSAATAGALAFVGYQARQTHRQIRQTQEQIELTKEQNDLTREEMETTLRPWLGLTDETTSYPDNLDLSMN